MTNIELKVLDYTCNQEEYDAIKEAIEKLTNASQDQFEAIKKEKWYNRVFDLLTFSKKGEMRLAEQIGTISQAQQIFVELLLRLSLDDSRISQLVRESLEDIRRIQEQNIYLLEQINQLEDISLGIKPDSDINKLSSKDKQLLSGCLYKFNNGDESSEAQIKYANVVLDYIDTNIRMDNPFASMSSISVDARKCILSCCMEYVFLKNCENSVYKTYEELIREFDLGSKTIEEIKEQIDALYCLRGCDGFYSKYKTNRMPEISDTFIFGLEESDLDKTEGIMKDTEIEADSKKMDINDGVIDSDNMDTFDEQVVLDECEKVCRDHNNEEYEQLEFNFPLTITEPTYYVNKEIHVRADIISNSKLYLINCRIYFNEDQICRKIKSGENQGYIFVYKCELYTVDNNSGSKRNSSEIDTDHRWTAYNLGRSLVTHVRGENRYDACNMLIRGVIHDCNIGTNSYIGCVSSVVSHCRYEAGSAFISEKTKIEDCVFYSTRITAYDGEMLRCLIRDTSITAEDEGKLHLLIRDKDVVRVENRGLYFQRMIVNECSFTDCGALSLNGKIMRSIFNGIVKINVSPDSEGSILSQCHFLNLTNAIDVETFGIVHKTLIDRCVFEKCRNVISVPEDALVDSCLFYRCSGYMVACKYDYFDNHLSDNRGGVVISNCRFECALFDYPRYKVRSDVSKEELQIGLAGITLSKTDSGNAKPNNIRNCVFNNVKILEGCLIKSLYGTPSHINMQSDIEIYTSISRKHIVDLVENCTISNWYIAHSCNRGFIQNRVTKTKIFKADEDVISIKGDMKAATEEILEFENVPDENPEIYHKMMDELGVPEIV